MRQLTSLAALALCAACVPVAVTPGVRLDDVSAAAYQAGRTQQAEQTQDAATATAGAFVDLRTATSAARTETAAQMVATGQAAAVAATLRALTPTATPPPSQTPRPTWTATPDATVAALRVEQATAERDAAQRWAVLPIIFAVFLGLLAIFGLTWAVLMMWVRFEDSMGRASSSRYIFIGTRMFDKVTREFIEPAPAPVVIEAPRDTNPQVVAEAARASDWRGACLRVALWAHEFGDDWTYEALGPQGAGVVSRPAWDRITDYLAECGYLAKRDRSRTRWADGVTYDQFLTATRASFPRDFPAGPAPAVRAPITAAQNA